MTVFQTILSEIKNNVYFVFPSEVAAVMWARKICLSGEVRSVAANRFMAWDRFKEEAVHTEVKNKKPVSSIIRKLFARRLVRENAASRFLTSVIPEKALDEFAITGETFAPAIAAMLPALAFWEERQKNFKNDTDDNEDRDLRIIKIKYTDFLESCGLFEPSWEKAPFVDTGRRYIIFFPETLDDFIEYSDLLVSHGVEQYSVHEVTKTEKPKLLFFESAKTELRTAAMELCRLHEEEQIPWEDMALSLPDYQATEPYVTRELYLRDIPFSRRAGKNLGDYSVAKLFSLAGECASSLCSFDSLKLLLLNFSIPWKDPQMNRALVKFGVDHHCVSPYKDGSRIIDPWEEAFKKTKNNPELKKLSEYYTELKKNLTAMTKARNFAEILEKYFVFRSFLDMEKCGPESNAVLARCVEELLTLIETEKEYPELLDPNPFAFYVSHLNEKKYVYISEGGVNIYDYPVAAGAPFGCHMVLNVSQGAAELQHRPLPFLRQDKRARLKAADRDISAGLLALYSISPRKDYVCHTRLSASQKSFTGWAIPHSAFALNLEHQKNTNEQAVANPLIDSFIEEKKWWATVSGTGKISKLPHLYSVQRKGFEKWSEILLGEKDASTGKKLFSDSTEALLRKRIADKNRTETDEQTENSAKALSVSATDLTVFFSCPVSWLYKSIFRLEKHHEDAALLDDESRGLFYHDILYFLFKRIQEKDGKFIQSHLKDYCLWAEEITDSVLSKDEEAKGAFLSSLKTGMIKHLVALLKTEADTFAGFTVEALEQDYEQDYKQNRGNLKLNGRIDRISSIDGKPMIIDYKTNYTPSKVKSRVKDDPEEGEIGLEDFQIAMYIKLFEEKTGKKVDKACFVSITKHTIVPVVDELDGKKDDPWNREKYENTMNALEKGIDSFDKAVSSLNFKPLKMDYKTCQSCGYKTICRSLYYLNPRPSLYGGQGTAAPALDDEEDNDEF